MAGYKSERNEEIFNLFQNDRSVTMKWLAEKYGLKVSGIQAIIQRERKARGLVRDRRVKK